MKKIQQQVQKEKSEDFHHFRLFSYLSMTVLSIAILVGIFVIIQHFMEEERTKTTLANQESVIQNQKLLMVLNQNQTDALSVTLNSQKNILELINITNRDNAEFFKILDEMTGNQTKHFEETIDQNMNHTIENSQKLDKIIEYLKIK